MQKVCQVDSKDAIIVPGSADVTTGGCDVDDDAHNDDATADENSRGSRAAEGGAEDDVEDDVDDEVYAESDVGAEGNE